MVISLILSWFKRGFIYKGICQGVDKVGELIKLYYPATDININELDNEVILEK